MTKFKIILPNMIIEFATEAEAQAYKLENNLSESIESFESEQILEDLNIPPISPRQIRLQLLQMEITNQNVVDAITAAIPEPDRTQALIEWEYSVLFERRAPFVDAVGLLLGLNSAELDSLWLEASLI